MTAFTPPRPHGPIDEVAEDVFVVRGEFPLAPLIRISRTMTIVRDGDDLTLLNAIRLSPEAEGELEALGSVEHVVRLGHGHGSDDRYYCDRYKPTYWAAEELEGAPTPTPLAEGEDGPVTGSEFLQLPHAAAPEAVLVVPQGGGTVVACDSMMNLTDSDHSSFLGNLVNKLAGFVAPASIARPWAKRSGGDALKADYERILERPFENLVGGHGSAYVGGANAAVRESVDRFWT